MKVLRRVASTGRAVIVTIHQPSAALFYQFDRLLLLHRGGVVFDGPIGFEGETLVNYFESMPLPPNDPPIGPMPPHANPAAWMLEVIGAGTGASQANKLTKVDFVDEYAKSQLKIQNEESWRKLFIECSQPDHTSIDPNGPTGDYVYARSCWHQFHMLVHRLFVSYWRDLPYNGTRTLVILCASIVFGLLWLDLKPDSQSGVQSQLSALYFSFYFVSLLQSASILPLIYKWKVIVDHESRVHTYYGQLFPLAVFVVEIPYIALQSLMFSIPFYFMCGFHSSSASFWLYVLLLFLVSCVQSGMGEFWAILIHEQALSKIPQVTNKPTRARRVRWR